jgi:superfamily II RNA helicase
MKILTRDFQDTSYDNHFSHWEFELSNFQKWAIKGIVDNKNIIITAHTGSGKTLPAEFAIQYFFNQGKKVVYTTPIKALSNEKFHDLQKKYPDISFGLLTGDIKFNPEADVIIMTTEILYNTLFQKKMIEEEIVSKEQLSLHFEMDIQTELGCVVFDEIHYINDNDRGRIWEETIMMLPNQVQMIGLSATIDKPDKFCNWVETVSGRETWLCPHDKRVVPLTHYSFLSYPDSYYKKFPIEIKNLIDDNQFHNNPIVLKKQNELFKQDIYHKVLKLQHYFDKENIKINRFFVMNKVVEYLNRNSMLPALCFIFSRKQTKIFAEKITIPLFPEDSTIPNTIKKECKQILMRLPNYREYICLPEYDWITKLLQKGIAVHHSGITPVFREMIEILFGKGYIKLLFATETFAVGINMPTKTVIFSSLTKFDGRGFRHIHAHEYTQMAGRAGRRGKDTKGYVIHLNNLFRENQRPSVTQLDTILSGKPNILNSKFKINFSMILKLISTNNQNFVKFIENSMLNDSIEKEKSQVKILLEAKTKELQTFSFDFFKTPQETLKKYKALNDKIKFLGAKKRKKMQREMDAIVQQSKFFTGEFKRYEGWLSKLDEAKKMEKIISNIDNYAASEVAKHLDFLEKHFFIQSGENNLILSEIGKMATNINEIHCLAVAELLENDAFNNLDVCELVAVFSVFCDLRLSDENKIYSPDYVKADEKIIVSIKKIKNYYNKYYDEETKYETEFMFNYNLQYDLVELVYTWAKSDTSEQCQKILNDMQQWDIFIGNFSKAILKICNIAYELENICKLSNKYDLLENLKKVPDTLQKFMITNSSLYI